MVVRRVFLVDGFEVFRFEDIFYEVDVYVLTGESFLDLFKKIKGKKEKKYFFFIYSKLFKGCN